MVGHTLDGKENGPDFLALYVRGKRQKLLVLLDAREQIE
jgi:hypothetical protein